MKIIALLPFYDEPVKDLVACVNALAGAGVGHLVAVDGAYALYPDGEPVSHPNQHAALHLACRQLGVALTIQSPATVWAGNETEKRSHVFALGASVADDGDWFLVIDADEVLTRVPDGLLELLAASPHDAAEVGLLDTVAFRANRANWPPFFTMRRLFRAQEIIVEVNHFTYVAADGRVLSNGNAELRDGRALEPCLDLTETVLIEHRPDGRPDARQQGKMTYYTTRDELGIERGMCHWCEERAVKLVPVGWQMNDRMGAPVAQWREGCAEHARDAEIIGAEELRALGFPPEQVVIENRNGKPLQEA